MSNTQNLAQKTVKGTLWNYGAFAASKGIIFVSTIILARLLAPEDFGLLALGLIAINYIDVFSDFGVGAALIYRQDNPERTANVAFGLSIGVGAFLTLLTVLAAPLVAAFFNDPRIISIIQVLSLGFIIAGLRNIHESRLKKELDFRRRFIPEIGKTMAKGGVSITLALLGFGVWSLVWGQLAGGLTSTILYWWVTRWRPRLIFDFTIARSLISYGFQLTMVGFLGLIHKDIDYLIVGRRMDATQLGFYTMAFRLPELIIINVCYMVSQALFPAYAKLQNNIDALRQGFLTTLRYISLITVPAGIGMFMIAPEFIYVFYTEQWAPAIPVMQALSIYAVIYSLSFNAGDIYKATGRPSILNKISVVKLVISVPVLWLAAGYSIYYVALAQVLTTAFLTMLRLGIASRIVSIQPGAIVRAIGPATLGALVMFVGMTFIRTQILDIGPLLRLIVLVFSGVLLYMGTLWLTNRSILRQAADLLNSILGRKQAATDLDQALS